MINIKDIDEEMKQASSLKELTQVYGEIASTRMKKIRGFVIRNREYLGSIKSIFEDTLSAFSNKLSEMISKGKLKSGGNVTFLAHNGKSVSVLISSNTGFFGNIVNETFLKFISEIRKTDTEVTIIGKVGRSLFLEAEPKRPYVFFDLADFGIDNQKLTEVIRHLVQYTQINIYFGKYQSVVRQMPDVQTINAGTQVSANATKAQVQYIFEPSVEDILMFFETQIFASIFDQSIRESQLAKFASRILAMDSASQNVDKRLSELHLKKLNFMHKLSNDRQLNSLSPVVFKSSY
jgi:F-type H+-transporting ATPase subunit gamma